MLTVLKPAKGHDLIELATVKTRLGITDSADDVLLAGLITEASSYIQEQLWPLARQQYDARLAGLGRTRIVLPRRPLEPATLTLTLDGEAETDFVVESAEHAIVFLDSGFSWGSEELVKAVFYAGYLLPGTVSDWSTGAKAQGVFVRPTSAVAPSRFRFECTTAGNAGVSQPDWTTADDAGDTITDGAVTWTAREAQELPAEVSANAWLLIKALYDHRDAIGGLARIELGEVAESYATAAAGSVADVAIPASVERFICRWRAS